MLLIPTLLCPKSWEAMSGNESQRFCAYCKRHVHNLEALSVSERLALLSSPAASICSRYRVAIRRPVKGQEESYLKHLVKYGAGVAVTGSVLLVLWEMQARAEKQKYYRTATSMNCPMPGHLYTEHSVAFVGMLAMPAQPALEPEKTEPTLPPDHVDLLLNSTEIDRLIDEIKPEVFTSKPVLPLKTR